MPETSITRLLKSAAREGHTLQHDRYMILSRLLSRNEPLDTLPEHLRNRLLRLRSGWKVLDFSLRDWEQVSSSEEAPDNITDNLSAFAVDYIIANSERVEALLSVSQRYSDVALGNDPLGYDDALDEIDEIDRQSIFFIKSQGLFNQTTHERYVDYIRSNIHSRWVRQRLVGPMVHHALNTPHDSFLDTFLSYMLPQDDTGGVERGTVRHILRDDLSFSKSLAYRSVICLFSHPFDALESLTNHFEIELVRHGSLSAVLAQTLRRLTLAFPSSRAARLSAYWEWRYASDRQDRPVFGQDRLPAPVTDLIQSFVQTDSGLPDLASLPTESWRSLARMRWSRYPEPSDFDTVTLFSRVYGFLDAGRLFSALNTSMYMLPRDGELVEGRHLLRLHAAVGRTTPYIWGAPRGDTLLAAQKAADVRGWLGADLRAGATLARQTSANDRTWFHAVHWELRRCERAVHVRNWLKVIRQNFPVLPRYLTGVDWAWIDRILPVTRVTPFRDGADGPYALLLRDIEEQQRDSTLLRTAIEPLNAGVGCADFVKRLIEEYGSDATAFVLYFLTAETIMLLEMAPNMTAALSDRISALETCAAEFGFGTLLSEEDLRLEQQALTASLMLLRVNDRQFDVPWATFKRDAGSRQSDNFNAHLTMRKGSELLALVTDARFIYSHLFPNGRNVEYHLTNRTMATRLFILGVIDAFYDHPSYGIEAILSTRFRHDTMRREFVSAFEKLDESHIQGVVRHEQHVIIESLSGVCLSKVDEWLQRRVQTVRPNHGAALFDLTPDQESLETLSAAVDLKESLEDAIEAVIAWMTDRLDQGLKRAQESFGTELWLSIKDDFEDNCRRITAEFGTDPEVLRTVASAVSVTFQRQVEILREWFARPTEDQQIALTLEQIKKAVDGRFEKDVRDGRLSVSLGKGAVFTTELDSGQVKLFFDLQTEIVRNALKYSGLPNTKVRMSMFSATGRQGVVFSSLSQCEAPTEWTVKGHPFKTLSDSIFKEGDSGLHKVAGIAASICGADTTIRAIRKRNSFHLVVPLGHAQTTSEEASECPVFS